MKEWGYEEFEKAIENYDQALAKDPGNEELLERYQLIQLEYSRLKK